MKPVGPEQTQDTHKHDYIALFVRNLKKYKRMKRIKATIFNDPFKIEVKPASFDEIVKGMKPNGAITKGKPTTFARNMKIIEGGSNYKSKKKDI